MSKPTTCPTCKGWSWSVGGREQPCPTCNGTGTVPSDIVPPDVTEPTECICPYKPVGLKANCPIHGLNPTKPAPYSPDELDEILDRYFIADKNKLTRIRPEESAAEAHAAIEAHYNAKFEAWLELEMSSENLRNTYRSSWYASSAQSEKEGDGE